MHSVFLPYSKSYIKRYVFYTFSQCCGDSVDVMWAAKQKIPSSSVECRMKNHSLCFVLLFETSTILPFFRVHSNCKQKNAKKNIIYMCSVQLSQFVNCSSNGTISDRPRLYTFKFFIYQISTHQSFPNVICFSQSHSPLKKAASCRTSELPIPRPSPHPHLLSPWAPCRPC